MKLKETEICTWINKIWFRALKHCKEKIAAMASAGSTGANDTANDASRIPCTKIFIQRDFSDGTSCRFSTKFPPELENKVDRGTYENTLNNLNQLYAEAERIECKTLCEGCFSCMTAYLIFFCMDSHYDKTLKKVARYIAEQNEQVYLPRGLMLTDPIERGLRCIEIAIFNEPTQVHTWLLSYSFFSFI